MGSNIFGGDDKKNIEIHEKIETHSKAIINLVERQKDLEASLDLLNDKIELLDHNAIKNFKDLFKQVKSMRTDIRDLKHELSSLNEFANKTSKQFKLMASKDEVLKLDKYIDLWNPMNFVTREELLEKGEFNSTKIITQDYMKEFEKKIRKELKEDLTEIIKDFLQN